MLISLEAMIAGVGPLLFGVGLRAALRILGNPDDNTNNPVAFLLRLVANIALAVGLLLVIFGGLGPIVGLVALILLGVVVREVRGARRRMLLELLALAAERNLPLAGALEAFAAERSGWPARPARRLAARLAEGQSLADALEDAKPSARLARLMNRLAALLPFGHALAGVDEPSTLFSPEARLHIRLGQELGLLAPALREALGPSSWEEVLWRQLTGKISYLTFLLLFILMQIVFLMMKIVPCYERIFKDYETELPSLTKDLVLHAHTISQSGGAALLVCVCAIAILASAYALLRLSGAVRWNLPGMDRLLRGRHAGSILDTLARSTRCQRPLPQTFELLARHYPRSGVRRRLTRVCRDIRAGGAWCASLATHGLITPAEAAVLQAAQSVGNLPWALHEMAVGSRRRLGYRVQGWMQVAFPLAIALLGVVVMLVALGMILPLVRLIQSITRLA